VIAMLGHILVMVVLAALLALYVAACFGVSPYLVLYRGYFKINIILI